MCDAPDHVLQRGTDIVRRGIPCARFVVQPACILPRFVVHFGRGLGWRLCEPCIGELPRSLYKAMCRARTPQSPHERRRAAARHAKHGGTCYGLPVEFAGGLAEGPDCKAELVVRVRDGACVSAVAYSCWVRRTTYWLKMPSICSCFHEPLGCWRSMISCTARLIGAWSG